MPTLTLATSFPPITEIRPWIALGLLVALLLWETTSPFFHFPKGRERVRHGFRNVLLGILNAVVTALIFVGLWWTAASWAESRPFGLLHWLTLPVWIEWLIAILLFDAWTYYWHRINHRIPFLWRFHCVHHSDPHMDVTTANRFHIGEIIFSSLLRVPLIALLGAGIEQLAVYEILMFSVVQFHHANIGIFEKWDRVLRLFIVTPYMHKVHHSRWQPETDSNYSSLLSIWDRLFRSFLINEKPETIRLGLEEFDRPADLTIPGLLRTPLANRKADRPRKP
jgi:sterol desaturase/sphingolipid hydroxylase (fatty acid hydroxylase superfamily)